MTIINPKTYMDGIWDWVILKGCFGDTKIEPTDIDGFVERKNSFLVLETKNLGVPLKKGQKITFNALINTGFFTIIIVWGERNQPRQVEVLYPCPIPFIPKTEANLNDLRAVVCHWFNKVDQGKPLTFYIPPNMFRNLLVKRMLATNFISSNVVRQSIINSNIYIGHDKVIFYNFKTYIYRNTIKQHVNIIQPICQDILGLKVQVIVI